MWTYARNKVKSSWKTKKSESVNTEQDIYWYLLKSLCLQQKVFSEFLRLPHMERVPLALDDKHHFSQVYNKHREKHIPTISSPFICLEQGTQRFPIENHDINNGSEWFCCKASSSDSKHSKDMQTFHLIHPNFRCLMSVHKIHQMLYLLAMQKVFLTLNKENIGTIFWEEIKTLALWFLG